MSHRPKVADPTEIIWPVIDLDKEKAVLEVLESVFSKYKTCLRTVKKLPKWKKKTGDGDKEDSLTEEEEKQKKEFKSMFVVGIQTVMRSLEKDQLSAVLLWRDMQPAVLRKALLHLLHEHGCSAICVSDLLSPIQKSWPGLSSAASLGVLRSEVPNDFHDLVETVKKHAPQMTNLKDDNKAVIKPLTETKVNSDIGSNKANTSNVLTGENSTPEARKETADACIKLNSSNVTGSKTLTPPVANPTKYFIYKTKADDSKSFARQSFIAFDEGTQCDSHSVETVKGVRVKTKSDYISSRNRINFGIRPSLIDLDGDQLKVVSGNDPTCKNSDLRDGDAESNDRKRKAADQDVDTNSEYKKINVKKFQKNMQKNKKKKNKKNKKK